MAVGTERLSRSRKLATPRELGILFLALAAMAVLIYLWQGRETPVPRVDGLSGSAVENSGAFARELGVPVTGAPEAIFGSGAYVREFAGTASVALSPAAIETSGASLREVPGTAPKALSAEAIQSSGAYIRELAAGGGTTTDSSDAWTHAREAVAPEVDTLSPQALFHSMASVREAGN